MNDREARVALALGGVALGLWLALGVAIYGCSAFVGPATAPSPCPVRCETGLCCPYDNVCRPGGKCERIEPWAGAARDAGADAR